MTTFAITDVDTMGYEQPDEIEADSPGEAAVKWAFEHCEKESARLIVALDEGESDYPIFTVSRRVVGYSNGSYSVTISAKPEKRK